MRAIHLATVIILAGSLWLTPVLVPGRFQRPQRVLALGHALLLGLSLVSWLLWFWLFAASIFAVMPWALPSTTLGAVLWTDIGRFWLIRLSLGALLAGCLRWRPGAAGPAALFYLCSASFGGHAGAASGLEAVLMRSLDMLHLMGAAIWTGGAIPLLLLVHASGAGRRAIWGYGRLAWNAAVLVAMGGVGQTLCVVLPVWQTLSPVYLGLVLVKLLLFLPMAAIGLDNRYRVAPALATAPAVTADRLQRRVALALLIGLAAIAAGAVLGITDPVADPTTAAGASRAWAGR